MAEEPGDDSDRSNGRVSRMQWKDSDMKAAVSSGEMTVTASSGVFKVPRKTLDDRIKGNVAHGTKPGRTTVLTSDEENSLTNFSFTWLIEAFL